jgi:hypothetical protein
MMVIALREVIQEGRAAICGEEKWIVFFWRCGRYEGNR